MKNENCDRKSTCYDYKHNHCDGCGANKPQGDLISREALKEHKFLTPQVKVIGGRHNGKTQEQVIQAYQKGWNDCIDAIIDNAPTIDTAEKYNDGYEKGYKHGYKDGQNSGRPQGEWSRHDEWVGGEYVGGFYHVNCPVDDGYFVKWRMNYCGNCGAPMNLNDKKGGAE